MWVWVWEPTHDSPPPSSLTCMPYTIAATFMDVFL